MEYLTGYGYRRRTDMPLTVVLVVLLAVLVLPLFSQTTLAAEERTRINKVRLEFTSDIIPGESGGDVEISAAEGEDSYYVSSWEILNVPEDSWNELEPPVVQIEINTDGEAYYFNNTSSGGFEFDLPSDNIFRRVEFEKVSRKAEKSTLILTVRMRFRLSEGYAETVFNPKKLKWEETGDETISTTGNWEKAIGAAYYQVQLEKDGVLQDKILSVYQLSHDFGSQITEPGIYRFWVRAVNEYKARGKWVKSNKMVITQEKLSQTGAGWKKTMVEAGTSEAAGGSAETGASAQSGVPDVCWWWNNGDGTRATSQWKEIDGSWYYFNGDGYMVTGWITLDGKAYYLDPESGAMYQNRQTPDGFTVGVDGARISPEAEQEGEDR